jgi:putative zinc finger protein
MTCDHAIELLPWLLNGSLAAEEREEVWHHLETCERCRQTLAETREAWSVFAQHLPSQNLVALAWGETPFEAVEEHLASCPRCAAELELTRMSRRLEEEDNIALFPAAKSRQTSRVMPWSRRVAVAAGLAAVVAASGWLYEARQASDLSEQLARISITAPVGSQQQPASETSSLREQVTQLEGQVKQLLGLQQENDKQVAAAQAQIAQLEKERGLLARPQATSMVDLGAGDVVRGESAEKTLQGGRYVTLLLPAREDGTSGERRAEIVNSSGKVVWQTSQLPVTQGYYSLVLPPHSLPPGRYNLRLSGRQESWTFQIVP